MVSDKITLDSDSIDICLNPRWPALDYKNLFALAEKVSFERGLKSHVWVATSGSTSESISGIKLVALSKEAFFASARAVNAHLQSDKRDIWAQVLPLFHVGGIGVEARARLSRARVVQALQDFKWDAQTFYQCLVQEKCTLTSLVPTQVYDLVQAGLRAPSHLRAIVVGGGALSARLYEQARELGWPLLPSYGMTETCSQIATATLSSLQRSEYPSITLLSHVEVRTTPDSHLQVKGPSLLTCYAQLQNGQVQQWDPKVDGWFQSEDKVSIHDHALQILGRTQDYVKIGGEAVLLSRLREKLEQAVASVSPGEAHSFALAEVTSERLGAEIHLFFESHVAAETVQKVESVYNQLVLPFERSRALCSVAKIPRTELGKIRYAELRQAQAQVQVPTPPSAKDKL